MRKKEIIVLFSACFSLLLLVPGNVWIASTTLALEVSPSVCPQLLPAAPFAGSQCPKHRPLFHTPGSSNITSSLVFSSLEVGTNF